MIILDTHHCVFLLRGEPRVVAAFQARTSLPFAVSIITVGELLYGALRSHRARANTAAVESFLDGGDIVPLDMATMRCFASIKLQMTRAGKPLEDPDLLIAATALAGNMTLVTHNRRHYARIPNLQLQDWFQQEA